MATNRIPVKYLEAYKEHLERDYSLSGSNPPGYYQVGWTVGSTYIHVWTIQGGQKMSHSWIVNKVKNKFNLGDILKSASWKAPATNFKRGNIFYGHETWPNIRWTGAF